MTILAKLTAIATALDDIITKAGQVQTTLTSLSAFLDTV